MNVGFCTTDAEIRATYPVMRQLRPHITCPDAYLHQVRAMQDAHGFSLLACWEQERCVGVAGFTIETRFYRGRMLYLADLVTDASSRARGVGKRLLDALKSHAAAAGCGGVMLDSGTQRLDAHAFYFREGFKITAFNFWSEVPARA